MIRFSISTTVVASDPFPLLRQNPRMRVSIGLLLVTTIGLAASRADEPPTAEAPEAVSERENTEFFEKDVLPILRSRCFECHGAKPRLKGGLRLTSREGLLRGGDSGLVVDLEKPVESPFLAAIQYKDREMPPSGKLPADEITILTRWIEREAPWSQDTTSGKSIDYGVSEEVAAEPVGPDPHYWAYEPVRRPEPPRTRIADWAYNSIDSFLLAKMEEASLTPAPDATPLALVRRACYDLTGLPPTLEEIDEFVANPSLAAYEALLDRWLASPHYGEKWGRHWLDLVRYAETHGYERDSPKPEAWKYRDYVIASFNSDKPYDLFVREQIAGDELVPATGDSITATGYYRLGIWDDEPADPLLARYDGLDDIVKTTSEVFLGMSLGCARCHDHKRDPLPQRDYYGLLAFFHDIVPMDRENLRRVSVAAGRDAFDGEPGIRVMAVREEGQVPVHLLIRGNPHVPGEVVPPATPAVLASPTLPPPSAPAGAGKRRALAEWITRPDHPLTARVWVNRLWQHHFGRAIVPTSNDFGKLGELPSHPELLDWLASELRDGGWKIKRLHKSIMSSRAYRMDSRVSPEAARIDPGNRWWSHFEPRRLTAEEIRDSMLAVTGELDTRVGGKSVFAPIPAEVLQGQSAPGAGWGESSPRDQSRRSVYVHLKRSLPLPILESHDMADTDSSCPARYVTTVPAQTLGMLNGEFTLARAKRLAETLQSEGPADIHERLRLAIRRTTGRNPDESELAADVDLCRSFQRDDGLSENESLRWVCLMLLNANEFVYLD